MRSKTTMLPSIAKLSSSTHFAHLTVKINSFHCFEDANMSTIKFLYIILASGIAVYLLFYSILVKKMPVVKIYFEDQTPLVEDNEIREESRHHTALKGELRDSRDSQSSKKYSVNPGKSRSYNDRARETILSFLEAFGLPVDHFETPTQPPRVNPNGASLPKLLWKLQQSLLNSVAPGKRCSTKHLRKVGLLEVNNNTVGIEDVEEKLLLVRKGGWWKPPCKPRAKVAIVVPFRNRESHLNIFLRHMHQFLQWQLLEYRIFITQQSDLKPFNRGMLMNVGFQEALKRDNFTCVIFHDVDLLPEDARNDYGCPSSPRHMSVAVNSFDYKLKYKTLFGGVEGFWTHHYIQINGFPNRFWGWGGEDDDLYIRFFMDFLRPICRSCYKNGELKHPNFLHDEPLQTVIGLGREGVFGKKRRKNLKAH